MASNSSRLACYISWRRSPDDQSRAGPGCTSCIPSASLCRDGGGQCEDHTEEQSGEKLDKPRLHN